MQRYYFANQFTKYYFLIIENKFRNVVFSNASLCLCYKIFLKEENLGSDIDIKISRR